MKTTKPTLPEIRSAYSFYKRTVMIECASTVIFVQTSKCLTVAGRSLSDVFIMISTMLPLGFLNEIAWSCSQYFVVAMRLAPRCTNLEKCPM